MFRRFPSSRSRWRTLDWMNPYSPPGVLPDAYSAAAPPPYAGSPPSSSGAVSDPAVELLRLTRPWVLLLGVLSFVASGLMVVMALLAVGFAALSPAAKGTPAALGLLYLPLGLIYIYPGIKLWSYGAAIARLTSSRAVADLEDALGQQKSFWKFSGIASIVLIVVYAIGFAVLMAVGAAAYFGAKST
jgi:hypothetical protein